MADYSAAMDQRHPAARGKVNLDTVCQHLALVAIDGATNEVALTLDPAFRLHVDGADTDRWGYLSLIEANHAAHVARPPLDVEDAYTFGDFVMARLSPRCLAHFRVIDDAIVELWMTVDWQQWQVWLGTHTMT